MKHPHTVLPEEILPLTSEYYLVALSGSFRSIYWILTLSLVVVCILLPFLTVKVTVKSNGILRPETEVNFLKATAAGVVKEILVRENSEVRQGQLLFQVRSPLLDERELSLNSRIGEVSLEIQDIDRLSNISRTQRETAELLTPLYRQSFADYKQRLADRQVRIKKVRLDFERNKKLFDASVISRVEFENYEFELNKATGELLILKQSQINEWQKDLTSHKKDLASLQDQLAQCHREQENLNVHAPVSGSIQNFSGIYPGSPVFASQDLAQISPATGLIAEVYTSPADVGLLHEGMSVRMQIMAFDHNQWGLLSGQINEISRDVQLRNNEPVYEIKCSLSRDFLVLKNGFKGKLKKGMTLQARFSIIERSLWQLLYDKADNWVNRGL